MPESQAEPTHSTTSEPEPVDYGEACGCRAWRIQVGKTATRPLYWQTRLGEEGEQKRIYLAIDPGLSELITLDIIRLSHVWPQI